MKIQINSKNQVLEGNINWGRGNTWANSTGHTGWSYNNCGWTFWTRITLFQLIFFFYFSEVPIMSSVPLKWKPKLQSMGPFITLSVLQCKVLDHHLHHELQRLVALTDPPLTSLKGAPKQVHTISGSCFQPEVISTMQANNNQIKILVEK